MTALDWLPVIVIPMLVLGLHYLSIYLCKVDSRRSKQKDKKK
jgi:hypothetical protein